MTPCHLHYEAINVKICEKPHNGIYLDNIFAAKIFASSILHHVVSLVKLHNIIKRVMDKKRIAHRRPVVAQGHKCMTVNATVCGFISHSSKYIYIFYFFALVSWQIAVLSSNTQCFQNSAECGIRRCAGYNMKLIRNSS